MPQVEVGCIARMQSKTPTAVLFGTVLVVFIALGWLFLGRVEAQGPTQLQGQLVNGTGDAPANSTANVQVTLFQITQAGPVTRTMQTNAQGGFLFSNIITEATAYFARVDYAGIRYFSEIRPPEIAAATPLTITVYETQPVPDNFTIDRVHLILDVQPKRFNGLELVQVTNPSDRAFYMTLPIPNKTSDVQFQDIREQTIVQRQDDGTILYPVLPTTTEILYGVILPYTPPEYRLEIPVKSNVAGFNLLVSLSSGVNVSGNNLVPGAPFTSQSGQPYVVFAGPAQQASTTFAATLSNLPGVDNTRQVQSLLLIGGGLGGLVLLAYPIYRRRMLQTKTTETGERVAQLEAIAHLDDAFDAGELEEADYRAQRAAFKAELLKDTAERGEVST